MGLISFNTASGRHCYFITFVFPSFQSGTRDVRPSSSLRSSAASHPSSHTASGKHCCNGKRWSNIWSDRNVSIPQAVGTVATKELLQQQRSEEVSIPQAVGTVATRPLTLHRQQDQCRFNTASGRHCCNRKELRK